MHIIALIPFAAGLVKIPSLVLCISAPLSVGLNILLVHGPYGTRFHFGEVSSIIVTTGLQSD
jgi:Na+-driven multidrug efflux pump